MTPEQIKKIFASNDPSVQAMTAFKIFVPEMVEHIRKNGAAIETQYRNAPPMESSTKWFESMSLKKPD